MVAWGLLALVAVLPAAAQQPGAAADEAEVWRFVQRPLDDARALVQGVTPQRTLAAAGLGGALFLLSRADEPLTGGVQDWPETWVVNSVEELGNTKYLRPLTGLVFLGTLAVDDPHLQDAAFTSFEAVLLTSVIVNGLKLAVGRSRPHQERGSDRFAPFSGDTSFPSGHSATAFALVTPWVMYYPSVFTPVLLVGSAGTAFTRLVTDHHWVTDVVAGSAIGFTLSYWLTRRHLGSARGFDVSPHLAGDAVGIALRVQL